MQRHSGATCLTPPPQHLQAAANSCPSRSCSAQGRAGSPYPFRYRQDIVLGRKHDTPSNAVYSQL
eukprot:scaffold81259_cov19-Prasinocladus_malaysianus.AAC.2